MKYIIILISIVFLTPQLIAEDIILDKKTFLSNSFSSKVPGHSYIILKGDIKESVSNILRDTYHLPVIKYWKVGNKVVFILETIGKHEFITTGFAVENNKIVDAKVLVYRENYGWEIKYDNFLNQIKGNSLKSNGKLVKRISNISGATLSVKAMRRLSKLSLYLYTKI